MVPRYPSHWLFRRLTNYGNSCHYSSPDLLEATRAVSAAWTGLAVGWRSAGVKTAFSMANGQPKGEVPAQRRTPVGLSLTMLLPPGMQQRSPALHCTNPWCLAVVCMIGWLAHVHIGHAPGSSLSARAIAGE